MPALALSESSSAILLQSLVPVTPGVITSLMPEDFLIVRQCVDSATRQTLRKINNAGRCYARYDYDFVVTYDITAEQLSPYGLANWHPGANLNASAPGASLPLLACANAVDVFGADGGVNIYENPVRTRIPGDLPGISFRIVRENCLAASANPEPALFALPAVADVTTISWPAGAPSGTARYDLIYGVSTIWIRRLTITGPVSAGVYYAGVDTWYTLPASTPAPADLTAFLVLPTTGTSVVGVNEITEVYTTEAPGGTILRTGSGLIPALLEAGLSIPTAPVDNFFYGGYYAATPGIYNLQGGYSATALTAADFIASQALPGDAPGEINTLIVVEVYSVHQAVWLTL